MSPGTRALLAPFVAVVGLGLALGGCTYREAGPPEAHFKEFDAKPPKADSVTVCHAYGCKAQTQVTFTANDVAELSLVMMSVPRDDSAREERRALAHAIGWMERRVAPAVGTATDRPSMDFRGSGDRSQQDCVDEATNATSYLLVLDRHGLIRRHAVERPFAKDAVGRWTHWAALVRDKDSGELFAIDSSASANGENPTVQSAASFYVPDSGADLKPPETGTYAATDAGARPPGAGVPEASLLSYGASGTASLR